jgi:hypothetical protein
VRVRVSGTHDGARPQFDDVFHAVRAGVAIAITEELRMSLFLSFAAS